jgi:hypothetical protein
VATVLGAGPRNVSIIAGCHADEPVGPITAGTLPRLLSAHFPELLTHFRFHIIPQMNPDGADRNRVWFQDPLSFPEYAAKVVREKPGDDIEFGFGREKRPRPECLGAMEFLEHHGPYCAHFSLHGMGFSEGAWFLVCREWVDRSATLIQALERVTTALSFPFHDIDREGEKGFTRIRPGFCTTPTSTAMCDHFLRKGDPETAGKFKPSSMEFVQSLGAGDVLVADPGAGPLRMVSEMPLFRIGLADNSKPGDPPGTAYQHFKDELEALREAPPPLDPTALAALADRYLLMAVPVALQVRLQVAMIVLALEYLRTQ